MQYNQDKGFVGIKALKEKHAGQIALFRDWARKADWERFHASHYDWWVFPISQPSAYRQAGQSWHNWPVRLFKAAQSVQLFAYPELFDSLDTYAHILMKQGQVMSYSGHDLSWLFTK